MWNQIKLFLNRSNINRGYCNMYNRRLYLGTIVNLQDSCKPSSQWLFSLQFKWLGERHEGTIPEALFLDVAMDDITPKWESRIISICIWYIHVSKDRIGRLRFGGSWQPWLRPKIRPLGTYLFIVVMTRVECTVDGKGWIPHQDLLLTGQGN